MPKELKVSMKLEKLFFKAKQKLKTTVKLKTKLQKASIIDMRGNRKNQQT